MLKNLFLFFFVIAPLFLTAAFYFISGSFFDVPHYNPLTAQWKNYTPNSRANPLEQNAEHAIALLNQGLTDEEEKQLIQYFKEAQVKNQINDWLNYLKNKKFQDRNALELFIVRFDEAIYQRGFSVEFLWKATIATMTKLIPHPLQNIQQHNKHRLTDLLIIICLDSTLKVSHFEDLLQYNAHAWAWHNNRDNSRYQFNEVYLMQDVCLTERTLLILLPSLFEQPEKVNLAVWKRIDALLEKPKCRQKGKFLSYESQRKKIQTLLKEKTL